MRLALFALLLAGCGADSPRSEAAPRPLTVAAPVLPDGVLSPVSRRPTAENLAGGTEWLNVTRPLAPADLRGRVVLVDFWTSCCINCLHTLPTLRAVEEAFPDELLVIGVHSPKFDNERDGSRLRDIVAQYELRHPIVVDANMAIWNRWGVHGWPTVVLVDAEGRVAWSDVGEPSRDELMSAVRAAVREAGDHLVRGAPTALAPPTTSETPLAYPSSATPLPGGGLAVSDTAHHRVLLFDAAGRVTATIGSGAAGRVDGDAAAARFAMPRGLTVHGNELLVADTENHAVRAIDLATSRVRTVAGTGELGVGFLDDLWSDATRRSLRSPWDVRSSGETVYVALAGSHQIAELDVAHGRIRRFAGDGREARGDGAATEAHFAQPSGLALGEGELFVADSETSSVRAIDLATRVVRTVVGDDLFVFGDIDGERDGVRLQHPLGIAYFGGAIYLADTYNGKVKRIDPQSGRTATVASGFGEPAGLAVRGDRLLVVDTNHHRLATLDVATRRSEIVALLGVSVPLRGVVTAAQIDAASDAPLVELGAVRVPRGAGRIHVAFDVPAGTAVNEDAPYQVRALRGEGASLAPSEGQGRSIAAGIDLDVTLERDVARLEARLDLVLCDVATHAVCVPLTRRLALDLRAGPGPARVHLALPAAHR